MEEEGEWKFEGVVNPSKGEASFTAMMDRVGRISVPRLVREKLGIRGEAILKVHLKVVESGEERRGKV